MNGATLVRGFWSMLATASRWQTLLFNFKTNSARPSMCRLMSADWRLADDLTELVVVHRLQEGMRWLLPLTTVMQENAMTCTLDFVRCCPDEVHIEMLLEGSLMESLRKSFFFVSSLACLAQNWCIRLEAGLPICILHPYTSAFAGS